MTKHILLYAAILAFLISCKDKGQPEAVNKTVTTKPPEIKKDSPQLILKSNIRFFADSLLKDNNEIVAHYLSVYQPDTCGIRTYKNAALKESFKGTGIIKGINSHAKWDTVFVMPAFNYCDDGESYCFFNKTLPRLHTDSYCCDPGDLFVVEDMDEDGIHEIGIYYSSCTGRYKSLRIYSLKENRWREIGSSDFDVLTQDPTEVSFDKLVKKLARNKFRICNFMEGKTIWETVTMK